MTTRAMVQSMQHQIDVLRRRIEDLEGENRYLRGNLGDDYNDYMDLGLVKLTSSQAKILACLMHNEVMSREKLTACLYIDREDGGAASGTINVFMHNMRRRLEPVGIAIETIVGEGYRLTRRNKALVMDARRRAQGGLGPTDYRSNNSGMFQ